MTRNTIYTCPSVRVIEVAQNRALCGSNGETQSYDSSSIWGAGTDNEE